MQNSKSNQDQIADRKSEATSDETLSDVDENEEENTTDSGDPGPSPDGELDEANELKDADAM